MKRKNNNNKGPFFLWNIISFVLANWRQNAKLIHKYLIAGSTFLAWIIERRAYSGNHGWKWSLWHQLSIPTRSSCIQKNNLNYIHYSTLFLYIHTYIIHTIHIFIAINDDVPSLPAPSGLPYQVAPADDQWVPTADKPKCFVLKLRQSSK